MENDIIESLRLMSWRTIGLCRNILHLGEGLNALNVMEVSSKQSVSLSYELLKSYFHCFKWLYAQSDYHIHTLYT